MRHARLGSVLLIFLLSSPMNGCSVVPKPSEAARGPLRIHPSNPRYFADDRGQAVYLTGAHTWRTLQDLDPASGAGPFDYPAFLDFLDRRHYNFFRLWRQEEGSFSPQPYLRIGPGLALDGKPKFDLDRPDPRFYERLASRVEEAQTRGVYVAVMLFQGWSVERKEAGRVPPPWPFHPFNKDNNVNGLDGDRNGNGDGEETHTLLDPAVTVRQVDFVQRVVDAVNRYDNVLYEIANESTPESMAWQEHLVRLLHEYESTKPKRHPVLLSAPWGNKDEALWATQAEAVAPGLPSPDAREYAYRETPPPNDGRKVVVNDTDHLWGIGGTRSWVWQSFLQGLNPIYMDPYDPVVHAKLYDLGRDTRDEVLGAMEDTSRLAERLPLQSMIPRPDLCSSRYCLVAPGKVYVAHVRPADGGSASTIEIDLERHAGPFQVTWRNLSTGDLFTETRTLPAGRHSFIAPFAGEAVLLLRAIESTS